MQTSKKDLVSLLLIITPFSFLLVEGFGTIILTHLKIFKDSSHKYEDTAQHKNVALGPNATYGPLAHIGVFRWG